MAHDQPITRAQFVELLAEAGANHNTIQAMFNAFTAGAEYMREKCGDLADECVNIEELSEVIRKTNIE